MKMTPLQSWFFHNVEGNVPLAQECRDRFDTEFLTRVDVIKDRIRDHKRQTERALFSDKYDADGRIIKQIYDDLMKEVAEAIEAALAEDRMGYEFPRENLINESSGLLISLVLADALT